jgi:4-hydroxy-2-oxoheptanedioate aldolase
MSEVTVQDSAAKRKLKSGGAVLAIQLNFVHAGLAEYLGRIGYDIIIADAEHGRLDHRDVEELARACDLTGATPMVRHPLDATVMERYLGIGVRGFQVPRIRSLGEARAVVDAIKFPPEGNRGLGNFRAMDFGKSLGNWPDFIARSNANTLITVMVEDSDGLAALPEIVKIPEIDAIMIGAVDLSSHFGVPGQTRDAKVVDAIGRGREIIKTAGKISAGGVDGAASLRAAYSTGIRYFVTSVSQALMHGSSELVTAMKELG